MKGSTMERVPVAMMGVIEGQRLFLPIGMNGFQGLAVDEPRFSLDVTNLTLFCQIAQPAGQLGDDAVLVGAHAIQIDARGIKLNPEMFRLLGLAQNLCAMKQRLGGDAAPVQAHAAGIGLGIDQGHVHTQVCGQKGRGIAAGSGPNYDNALYRRIRHQSTSIDSGPLQMGPDMCELFSPSGVQFQY